METQKTPIAKAVLRKKNGAGGMASVYTTELQSSRQYGADTKREIQTNGTRQRAQRKTHTPTGTLFLTKEAYIYNGAKTASSIDGAGKIGQQCAKE